METEVGSEYYLSKSFKSHNGAARVVTIQGDRMVTGGIDHKVVTFKRAENGTFEQDMEYNFFKDYIYSAIIIDDSQFVIGCKDKNIYICSFSDFENPLVVLQGHSGVVNSLSYKNGVLLSGSWDATAKIWDLESGESTSTLQGHAYAVCTCISSTGDLYTGSQDGNLQRWSAQGALIHKKVRAHSDIIRSIQETEGIGLFTCSNDATVAMWSLELDELRRFSDIHSTFVFALGALGGFDFVSGGEDMKLSVVKGGLASQSILMPGTLWSIAIDNKTIHQDIVTAAADGIIRVFSRETGRKATPDELESFEKEGEMAAVQGSEIDPKTIAKFPDVSTLGATQGKKEGEVKVFKENGVPKVYSWSNGKWNFVGDMVGQGSQKKHFAGDRVFPKGEYDYVFDVQDDSGSTNKLPFNDGDNVYTAAEKFLNREQMNIIFKEQIVNFILQNTRSQTQYRNKSQNSQNKPASSQLTPIREKQFFTKFNAQGLQKKVLELNEVITTEKPELALGEKEVKYFKQLVGKLLDPKLFLYIKEFSSFEIDVLKKLLTWPPQHSVAVLDLFRVFLTHHASQKLFSGLDSGLSLLIPVVGKLGQGPPVVWKLYGKILSNVFCHDITAFVVVKGTNIVLDSFRSMDSQNAGVVALIANFYMNFSSIVDCVSTANDEVAQKYVATLCQLIASASLNNEAILKMSIALVNFVVFKPAVRNGETVSAAQLLTDKLASIESPAKAKLVEMLRKIAS